MTDRYRPADAEADEFRRRLCEVILWALEKVVEQARPAVAVALADEIDAGRRRLMTRVEISGRTASRTSKRCAACRPRVRGRKPG